MFETELHGSLATWPSGLSGSLRTELYGPFETELSGSFETELQALSKLSDMTLLGLSCKALLKQSYVALLYLSSSALDLSYAALSSSSPREGARSFNLDLWRIRTDCVAFQECKFLYK